MFRCANLTESIPKIVFLLTERNDYIYSRRLLKNKRTSRLIDGAASRTNYGKFRLSTRNPAGFKRFPAPSRARFCRLTRARIILIGFSPPPPPLVMTVKRNYGRYRGRAREGRHRRRRDGRPMIHARACIPSFFRRRPFAGRKRGLVIRRRGPPLQVRLSRPTGPSC